MNVLTLDFKRSKGFLKYSEGQSFSDHNYIRSLCEASYRVHFNFKGFSFDEEIIINALTEYFDNQSTVNSIIKLNKLEEMFDQHSEHADDEEMTELKKIVITYLMKELSEV